MAIKGQPLEIQYTAFNVSTNSGQTADAANQTLRVNTDGISAAPFNAPGIEVDPTFEPGEYKILLTASEMNGNFIKLTGLSTTPSVRIIPVQFTTERGLMPLNTDYTAARAAKLDFLDAYISSRMPASAMSGGSIGGAGPIGSVAGVFLPSQIMMGVQDRLSVEGVALRLDDIPPHEMADVFLNAGSEIDQYVWQRYSPVALSGSNWVYQRYVDVAAFLLDERKNNPPGPGTTGAYKRAIKSLVMVQKKQLDIPNTPPRKSEAPVLSAPRTRLDPYPRQVIERALSTGKPDGYTRFDDTTENPVDYTI